MSEMKEKTAILLINTGSPDRPDVLSVGNYLLQFLGHKRIISIPWLFRKILVNFLIVPFRVCRSTQRYKQLWNRYEGKFPLIHFGLVTQKMLQDRLDEEYAVFVGMCFGKPSVKESIRSIKEGKYMAITVIPLFPHYASSSVGTALEMVLDELKMCSFIPEIRTVNAFYDHPLFIKAFAEKVARYCPVNYDCVLFSYHSLPISHVEKEGNYDKACFRTTSLIAEVLQIPENKYETVFQSQMSGQWQGPFADQTIRKKAEEGVRKILVVAPSFVADCLETTLEIGEEYRQLFLRHGGEQLDLVESLNDSPVWIELLKELACTG